MATKSFQLLPNTELRVEVSATQDVAVTLTGGEAEIFGYELAKGEKVSLTRQKVAIFTWTGCTIALEGEPDVQYVAEETPNQEYANLHHVLNMRRESARAAGGRGPRVLVVGPCDSGKSSLCRCLVNWAVRTSWPTTFVDLDIGQGGITVPGCIAATPVEAPVDPEEGYSSEAPFALFHGHISPADNPELYKFLVERLAAVLNQRELKSADVAAAGMVINTLGWIDGGGYHLMTHAARALEADVVCVMEQDRLFSQLSRDLKDMKSTTVVKLHKSGGVVTRSSAVRKSSRAARVREYFYGGRMSFSPASQVVRAEDLHILRIGGGPRAPSSALPAGAVSVADPLRITPVTADNSLVGVLLAVSHAPTPDAVLSAGVAGFLLVVDVDTGGNVTYLAPCPGQLPGRYLIAGSFQTPLS